MTVKFLGDSSTFEDTGPRDICPISQYTQVTTAGTTAVKTTAGVLIGVTCVSVGTGFAAGVVDISGTNTNTLIATTTATAGQVLVPGISGIGVRTLGSLNIITTGTPGQYNVFWD